VAARAASGASNAQIACQLSVSVSTVETQLERIYDKLRIYAKLGIRFRHELVAITAAPRRHPTGRPDHGRPIRPAPASVRP
jgi:DNA-binding CsgD family transcriptional regulator